MADETIVEAVGHAVASRAKGLSQLIEAAMSQAVMDAMADGVSDPEEIRARKLKAREVVKASQG